MSTTRTENVSHTTTGNLPTSATIVKIIDDQTHGVISPGGTTDDLRPLITGTGQPNSYVTVRLNALESYRVPVDADGHWSLSPVLTASHYAITVTGSDGVTSPPYDLSIADPVPQIEYLVDGIKVSASHETTRVTPTLKGVGAPGSTITVYDGDHAVGTIKVSSSGVWTFSIESWKPLSYGEHAFTAVSQTGKISGTYPLQINPPAPVTPPHAQVTFDGITDHNDTQHPHDIPKGGSTDGHQPLMFGSAAPGVLVQIYDRVTGTALGWTQADKNGHWEFRTSFSLPSGHYEPYAVVNGTATAPFPFDITTGITAPAAGAAQAEQAIDAVAEHGTDAHGSPGNPIQGTHPGLDPVIDHVYDNDGRELVNGAVTNDPRPVVTGHGGGQPGDIIYLLSGDWSRSYGQAVIQPDGSWAVHVSSDLLPGELSSLVAVSDGGGFDLVSNYVSVNEQGHTPSKLAITSISEQDGEPTLHGTANSTQVVYLYDGDQYIAQVVPDASGHWQFNDWSLYGVDPSSGTHSFTATQGDYASAPVAYTSSQANPAASTEPAGSAAPHDLPGSGDTELFGTGHPDTQLHDATTLSTPAFESQWASIETASPLITLDSVVDDSFDHPPRDISSGGTTDNQMPLFHGTAPAHTLVHIVDRVSGKVIGSGGTDANGHWTAYTFGALADGHYELYATAFGRESATFSFDVDHGRSMSSHDASPSAADLLAQHDAPLFAQEAQTASAPVSTAHLPLDVSDLNQVQQDGVHADVAQSAAQLPWHQEEALHHV